MANTIKQKRGSGSNPDANDLEVGEIAIRTDNGHLFTKVDGGSVVEHKDITNNNQLTNGAGYITSQRSVESVQDIVGNMVTGNTESGITVTYQDADGTLDFSVSSQTDQNFTTALKNKLDGIASSATNVTNNNQLTNGANYITSSNAAITNKMPKSGGTFTGVVSSQFSTSSGVLLNIYNTDNANGASIAFSDQSSQTQIGFLEYFHEDSASNGCDNSFHFDSNQNSLAVVIDQTSGNSGFYVGTNEVFHEGNDGSGSGLDADKLDGQQGSHYLDYNNFNNTPTIPTNNNQLTNGAGYVTANTQLSTEQVQDIVGAMVSGNSESNISVTYNDSNGKLNFSATNTNTQLSNEQVQDIVGDMVTGNTESGITVTYQDADGTLDFSVSSQTDNNFTNALKTKLDGIATGATNVTNNNQLTNGAGYITSQRSVESVQDIVGDMVTGNTESGITVTYQDADGTLDFSVASQTDNNFTTALKNKLDGIASSATNVTNNNQLTNGAGYLTSVGTSDIDNNAVSTAKMADMPTDRILGREASGTGDPQYLTATEARSILNVADGATNVTNTNQLTNGAGYITSSNAAITNKMPLAGGTFSGNVSFGDNNITNVGEISLDTIKGDADDNTNINFAGGDTINIKPAGTTRLAINTSGVTVTGALNVGTVKIGNQLIEKTEVILAKLSADPDIDVDDGNVFFFGVGETANATPNITSTSSNINSIMAVGDIMTVTVIAVSTGSGYYQDVTIDGSQPSFQRWLDDDEPTSASANGDFEVYTYTILKTGNNVFTILANRSVFK